MPEKYTYLLVDLFCILFPFLFSFHPRIRFYRQWRYFTLPCLVTALFFLVWDVLFTQHGVWGFNPRYVIGAYLFSLPLEEYLFFFCVPYACVFTYHCMTLFFDLGRYAAVARWLSVILAIALSVTTLFHLPQLYTSITFLLLSLLLVILVLRRVTFMPVFYISFLIILIPFFVSNGILTGCATAQPVVLYNNNYNLGIRMWTIPLEDTFYGMLLLLMNITGFEYLRPKI